MAAKKKKKRIPVLESLARGAILTDERISRHWRLFLLLAFFGFVLIVVRNWSNKTIREIEQVQKELVGLRAEYATVSAKLMDASRPSVVEEKVKAAGLNLKQPVRPPQKIIVERDEL